LDVSIRHHVAVQVKHSFYLSWKDAPSPHPGPITKSGTKSPVANLAVQRIEFEFDREVSETVNESAQILRLKIVEQEVKYQLLGGAKVLCNGPD
jgi:hypothetical protein